MKTIKLTLDDLDKKAVDDLCTDLGMDVTELFATALRFLMLYAKSALFVKDQFNEEKFRRVVLSKDLPDETS